MGGPEEPQVMRHALRVPWGVHWQVQINKDGLNLLTLCFSSLLVDEQTQENIIIAIPSAKSFSHHKVYHPYFTRGLIGFWVVGLFQWEVSKSSSGSLLLLFFFLTLQITFTNHRRTFSALLKRYDCRTKVMLVDNPYNIIPRWFAFIWKQVHLLGPGFGFQLQDASQQWSKGVQQRVAGGAW